mgnify:FL=1
MAFPFLGLFLVFLLVLSFFIKKGDRQNQKVMDDFWKRENEANDVRKKDISGLPYITIPMSKFPIGISSDPELTDYENDLFALTKLKILNLGSQTNTELKLKYGPANLTALSEYDQNFTTLIRTLVAYAKCLIKNGFNTEAVPVLEFGIEIGSDIRANYTLLANYYKDHGHLQQLDGLMEKASALDSVMKSSILEQLNSIKAAS